MFTDFDEIQTFFDSRSSLGIKPGLERMTLLLERLGNPQQKIRGVHVAGTNGKGSTLNYVAVALQTNGFEIGMFTSPSLSGLNGHILHNGKPISEQTFGELLCLAYPSIVELDGMDMAPTEFEIVTAMAFMYFSRHTDIALIEAGMGGRGDTTNCFLPDVTIITNVSMDHRRFLGNTIEEIAYQKAGIIKPGIPVVTGLLHRAANPAIEREAYDNNAELYQLGRDFSCHPNGEKGFLWKYGNRQYNVSIGMEGQHQVENASLAVMALIKLMDTGFDISIDLAIQSLAGAFLPGRFERLSENPLIVIDGAHNPDGIQAFVQTANSSVPAEEGHVIFAAFKDKDIEQMLNILQGNFQRISLVEFDHPRAARASDYRRYALPPEAEIAGDWTEVIDSLKETDDVHYITGSLHFMMLVRERLKEKV